MSIHLLVKALTFFLGGAASIGLMLFLPAGTLHFKGGWLLLGVVFLPMLAAGVSPKRTFLCAALTGLVEVVGTLIGYLAVSVSTAILPFALAFAGGTMLYVISDEMIPETHAHGHQRGATYALLVGFCVMLVTDVLLG